jgi:hypothetical protein
MEFFDLKNCEMFHSKLYENETIRDRKFPFLSRPFFVFDVNENFEICDGTFYFFMKNHSLRERNTAEHKIRSIYRPTGPGTGFHSYQGISPRSKICVANHLPGGAASGACAPGRWCAGRCASGPGGRVQSRRAHTSDRVAVCRRPRKRP